MSFLKEKNTGKQLYLQLKGFVEDTYLDVAGELVELPNFRLPKFDFKEEDLMLIEMPERLRLGNRLERFFSFIIEQTSVYNIVAENVQVFEGKQTIGELDFLLFDQEKKEFLHVELGGKIYLYEPKIEDELARWIGPNRRDSLLKKTTKLREKQFPLLYNKVTQTVLEENNITLNNIKQQICLKARLFVPKALYHNKFIAVCESNIKGYYLHFSEFFEAEYKACQFFLPNKQDWIVNPKYGEIWYSYAEIIPMIELALEQKMSPLVWMKKESQDYETFFVVWWE